MNSKVYSLRFRKRVSLRLLQKRKSAQYRFKQSDNVFNGRKGLQHYKLLCSNSLRRRCKLVQNQNIKNRFCLRSMANRKLYNQMNKQSLNKKNVKSKTKRKAVGNKAQSNVSWIKGIIKKVVSVRSCKRPVKINAVNLNKSKGYVQKYSKASKAGAGQNLKLVRSKTKVKRKQNNKVNVAFVPGNMAVPSTSSQSFGKMRGKNTSKKKQSNKLAISFSVGNSAVPSTSKQSQSKKMVKSKIKIKSVGKKSRVKKNTKKVLSVCSRKRHIKVNAKKLNKSKNYGKKIKRSKAGAVQNRKRGRPKKRVKGTTSTNIDVKKCKNKTSLTQIPSTSNQGSQALQSSSSNGDAGNKPQNTCAICFDEYKYPVKLPCSHTFCFLCAKGIILRDGRCALCRQIVPQNFLYNPVMVNKNKISLETNEFKWFYEGSNSSWWQYDDQSNDAIEEAFQGGSEKCDIMIAGFVYEINLKDMFQQRKYEYSIRRRIQRAKGTIQKRGIAGIEVEPPRKKKRLMLSRLQ